MDATTFLGYLVSSIVMLGSLFAVIAKFTQPINDLRVVIQKLNDNIDALKNTDNQHTIQIEQHGKKIDKLDHRVGDLEHKVDLYHRGPNT